MIRAMGLIRALVACFAICGVSSTAMGQIVLPKGEACPDFGIRIDFSGAEHRVSRTFYDKSNNPVRLLNAGQGVTYTFTNLGSGAALTVKTGGSVEHITPNPDGTQTWITTGHELAIFFPTDTPPGPASILYIGKLVFRLDPNTFTFLGIQSFVGKSTDICAALGG